MQGNIDCSLVVVSAEMNGDSHMRKSTVLAAGIAALLLSTLTSPATWAQSGASNSSLDSKEFVKLATQSNLAEIKTSQLAQSQAQSDEVKRFAQRMIDDHTKANAQLAQLAKTKNLEVPDDTDMMHKASMKMLQAKSGASFDTAYMKQMNKDHQKTIKLFETASSAPKVDKDLQALAAKLLPTLQDHEQMVGQTQSSLPSRSASSR